ncbi:hypothetical protein GCM10010910_03090 [Microbacterium nanhaiense]|uniref:Orc1-like AAA ATPase domain-containing protein n=1 Tax=Microbacterium nanhaiense TaxID=1301026 RepID=A0ABQ2MVY8_9MICO|nr:ATP-binding protein [Microbacterium nanhaiense]GGO59637.1 hypothetical protein GCM10010910_03090 [Microbacterium nanhaiense]
MLPSPYTPGDVPRVFIGRDKERDQLRDLFARVIAFGEMGGPLTIVTGPRGLGKTSLLREVSAGAERDGFVVAWLSGIKNQPFLSALVGQVSHALRRADIVAEPRRRSRLDELTVEVGVGIAKVRAKISAGDDDGEPSVALHTMVEDLFHEAASAVRDAGGAGLLIVIDELHAPLEPKGRDERRPEPEPLVDAAVLLNAIQNMGGDRRRYPLVVLGAGLPQTKTLLTHAATFSERIRELTLTGFDGKASAAVLTEAARPLGVTWSAEALQIGVARAQGYPQTLQVVGDETWQIAKPNRGDVIEIAHVEASLPAVDEAMGSMFRTRWAVATERERTVLRTMARLPGDVVERAAIAAEMQVDSEDLGMVRRSLIQKGIIEPAGRGLLRFTIPGFDAFVLEQ